MTQKRLKGYLFFYLLVKKVLNAYPRHLQYNHPPWWVVMGQMLVQAEPAMITGVRMYSL